jgi:EAL domain-containing protein (putative c-di-GMP-specific phosphodiesterase class I)
VADAVREWPDMRLMTNFPSSVHLRPPDEIRRVTREILEQGANTGRLQIQISENVPPFAWRTSVPIIAEEILAWGAPAIYR